MSCRNVGIGAKEAACGQRLTPDRREPKLCKDVGGGRLVMNPGNSAQGTRENSSRSQIVHIITGMASTSLWVLILWMKIAEFEMIACVMLPEHSIRIYLWSRIIFPAMTAIVLIFILANSLMCKKFSGANISVFSLAILFAPLYLLFTPNLAIDHPQCLQLGRGQEPVRAEPF